MTQPSPRSVQETLPTTDLSTITPTHVALSAFEQAQHGSQSERPSSRSDEFARALTATLTADAVRRQVLEPRAPPRLQRATDGAYRWQSRALSATIAADGTVTFKDRPAFEFDGIATQEDVQPSPLTAGALPPSGSRISPAHAGGLLFRFDLTDLIERARGHELYAAERSWFLEQTAQLRQRLALQYRLCRSADQTQLRAYLSNCLRDDAASTERLHDAILEALDACVGSAFERAASATIVRFIRTELPAGSPRGFSVPELARLNRMRGTSASDPDAP